MKTAADTRSVLKASAQFLLADAIASGEIATAFQPKVTLATRELIGVEALARWHSPALGPVPPEIFIPIAERSGLIGKLTDIVLRDALDTAALLRRHAPDITMAVNISPILLADRDLQASIGRALLRAGVPPGALVAEITESHAIPDTARARATRTGTPGESRAPGSDSTGSTAPALWRGGGTSRHGKEECATHATVTRR